MAGVKRYEDLDAWRIADELKLEVYALTAAGPASRDIAEGFGRFRPADNARFAEFAVSSTMETKESLKDGVDRGYLTPERVQPALELPERSIQCSVKYILYLKRCAKARR